MQEILVEYQDMFKEPIELPPLRGAEHQIQLQEGAILFKMRPYRYPYMQRKEIETMIEDMLRAAIIQPSSSPFASLVLLVKKNDGSWRLCVYYRKLNSLTVKDSYPIPLIDDLLDELGGARVFSKIDLRVGYHQIRVKQEDVHKTAFVTSTGHYEFNVMPVGLTNVHATFQSLMNEVFIKELKEFVRVFFDDILIYSPNEDVHCLHLRKVIDLLRKNFLYAKASKCSFGQNQIKYLGHIINHQGVVVDPSKIQSIKEWPLPQTVKALRGFLGLIGYYRKFVKNYGVIAKSVTALLKKGGFKWNLQAAEAFYQLKQAMTTTLVLQLPDFSNICLLRRNGATWMEFLADYTSYFLVH